MQELMECNAVSVGVWILRKYKILHFLDLIEFNWMPILSYYNLTII